ncbi:MAG TPA: PAS domain S-box protein [Ignavibacteriaceae bacterium]|nr:PAS domain S-box protein [Ignavibacteriaceae bacterium]
MPGSGKAKTIVLLSVFFYAGSFFLFIPFAGEKSLVLSLIPIITVGIFYGSKSGVISAGIFAAINIVLLSAAGLPGPSIMVANLPGIFFSLIMGWVIGWVSDLFKKSRQSLLELSYERELLRKEISERKKAEDRVMILDRALNATINSVVITDPKLPDNPVIYINPAFERITGYKKEDILGKNCRMLQGPETSKQTIAEIREAVKNKRECDVIILNYKKDGTPFWSDLSISPVKDSSGDVINFIGIKSDISGRIDAEEALKRSEEKFRSIVEHLDDGIVLTNEEGIIIEYSARMESILGVPAESIIGKYLWKIPPINDWNDLELLKKEITKSIATNTTNHDNEFALRMPDGSEKIIMVIPVPIKTKKGFVLSHIFRDLTSLRKNEDELKKLSRAVETSPSGIVLSQMDGKIVYVNPAVLSLGNYRDKNEFIGKSIFDFTNEAGKSKMAEIIPHISAGKIWHGEIEVLNSEGEFFPIAFGSTVVTDENNKPKYLIAVYNDISERKKAELALIESETKYRNVVENVKEVIFQTDASGKWVYLNPAWHEITGYTVNESLGELFLNYVHPEDREKNLKYFEPIIKREKDYCRHTVRYLKKEEGFRWIEVYARPVLNKQNEVLGTTGTLTDVTERKKAEEEIKSALQKERELNDLKSRFISTVSHEFRTPLTSILASNELIQRYFHKWNDEKKLETLKRIEKSVLYMNEMINDVLTLNKAESGRLEFRPVPMDLVELSKNILEEIKLIAKPEHNFAFDFDKSLSNVRLDEKLIRNIIINLLSNSVKYSPAGGLINFALARNNGHINITIEDHGIGIPDEDQKRLFQPFLRGTNIENIPGTGLGLTILERAVNLHKGKISFESQVGKGTKFTITIPDSRL